MYAVIETGGKQYRVELGTELAVERLDATPGTTINFDRVLLVADGDDAQIGTPTVADALVTADVLRQDRGEKIDRLQVPAQGAPPLQEGPPPGADRPARRRHPLQRPLGRRRGGCPEDGASRPSASAAEADAEKKAAADQALAAKLAADR